MKIFVLICVGLLVFLVLWRGVSIKPHKERNGGVFWSDPPEGGW